MPESKAPPTRKVPARAVGHALGHPEDSVGLVLKQVHHLMRLAIEERMRGAGLGMTHSHAMALYTLQVAPGSSGADLARAAMVTPQTMNGILVTLEDDGLISRRPDPQHGRILAAYITDKGKREFARGVAIAEDLVAEMQTDLSRSEQRQLLDLLLRCLNRLGTMAGDQAAAVNPEMPLKFAPKAGRGAATTSRKAGSQSSRSRAEKTARPY